MAVYVVGNASVAGKRIGHSTARIGDVTGGPVVVGQRAYVGNHSGRTVAFDLEDGSRIWTTREGAVGPVWPAGGSLFQVSDLGRLLRLDANTGEVIWAVRLPGYLKDKPGRRSAIVAHYGPVLAGGNVIVASNDGLLRLFKPEDGSLVRTVEVPWRCHDGSNRCRQDSVRGIDKRRIARFPLTPECAMGRI